MRAVDLASAYVALGSNIAKPLTQVRAARVALAALPYTRVQRCSSLYRSAPIGDTAQPDFINAVCALETRLSPPDLMRALLAIEHAQGRRRDGNIGGPRTLDLDLLLYDDATIASEELHLPHPRLHERAFVLYPLAEIAPPSLHIPGQAPLRELLPRCATQALTRLTVSWHEENDDDA